jgi:hypothetical protein
MIFRLLTESCGMNFARQKCDQRAAQGLMRENTFSLHLGKKHRAFADRSQRFGVF